jgi:hypothetical protein
MYVVDEVYMVETWQKILVCGAQEILAHGAFVATEQKNI